MCVYFHNLCCKNDGLIRTLFLFLWMSQFFFFFFPSGTLSWSIYVRPRLPLVSYSLLCQCSFRTGLDLRVSVPSDDVNVLISRETVPVF